MKILSIQVGMPQTLSIPEPGAASQAEADASGEKGWFSGIFKESVEGPLFLDKTNLAGDAQGDLKNHGGPDKAICVYPHEHYAFWQREVGRAELPIGAFGENFTTQGWTESNLCIGDSLSVGDAGEVMVQVSQPRQPCWKLARRWQIKDFALHVQDVGFTGWYFRVRQEGMVQAGDPLQLVERPYPHLTLAEANRVMHHDKDDWEAIEKFLACPLLSASWQKSFRFRLNTRAPVSVADRIYGRS